MSMELKLKSMQHTLIDHMNHIEICGERSSYSKTDRDATFMHGKEDYYNKTGIFKTYYNLQIGVSDGYIIGMIKLFEFFRSERYQ